MSGPPTDRVTIAWAMREGAARLADVADNPRLEARLLLAHALGVTAADLIRDPARMIDPESFLAMIDQRSRHEPIAYLTGHREFWSLDLLVSPATLIPRPDTETIVEQALRAAPAPRRVLDLGTGSGCLLLAILHERPAAFGIGIDRSADAIAIARANARRCGLDGRAAFTVGDWATAVAGPFDLVVSNPPYIPHDDIAGLMPEVRLHEPLAALDGGEDGLVAYRHIIPDLPRLIGADGVAVLEVGIGQADTVAALGRAQGMASLVVPDLAGVPRAVVLRLPKKAFGMAGPGD